MNDNENPNPQTRLTMNLTIAFNVNCAQDDERLKIYQSDQFVNLLDGPIAVGILNCIQQFTAHFAPDMILTAVPDGKPSKEEMN